MKQSSSIILLFVNLINILLTFEPGVAGTPVIPRLQNDDMTIGNSNVLAVPYRLPGDIRPSNYNLTMRMILDEEEGFTQFTTQSFVDITIYCVRSTNLLVLNSQYSSIDVDNVKVLNVTNKNAFEGIPIVEQTFEPNLHFYKIRLGRNLTDCREPAAGDDESNRHYFQIRIPYTGLILTNDTLGLYRGFYTDSITNVTKNMATTFFQPFGARRMLPCLDEPDMKAKFEVTIGRREKYHTLANMNLKSTTKDSVNENWFWDTFYPTVPMSTYIVCIIVSDFSSETADPSIFLGKPVKVWSTPAAIQDGGGVYAAEMGARLLNWYENYTGIPYALPKMDSAAIPQFAAGAMENWGMNTYRDAYLIYRPQVDAESARIGVAETLSHELSHQWFGNLVTCKDWAYTWLNEGLATFFTYKALITTVPEFDTEMRFISRHHQNSLKFDSNPNKSHPVVIPTDDFNFFDGTSMEKGGSLTRMMEYIFTMPVLKTAFRIYLNENAFGGVEQDDLFQAIETSISQFNLTSQVLPKKEGTNQTVSVKEIMDTWTLQTGYPLVRVSRINNTLTFTQENIISSQPGHRWWIPIRIVSQDNPDFSRYTADLWISPSSSSATYELPDNATNKWVICNPHAVGFYRTVYDSSMIDLIQKELLANPNAFTPITRSQLLDDWLNLATLGIMSPSKAIEITEYLALEKSPSALISAVSSIVSFYKQVGNSLEDSIEIKQTLLSRLEGIAANADLEETGMVAHRGSKNILLKDLLKALCDLGSESCVKISNKL